MPLRDPEIVQFHGGPQLQACASRHIHGPARFAMDEWEKFEPLSGEAADQFLRYRLAVITAFLLALVAAALVGRAWPGEAGYDADHVETRR